MPDGIYSPLISAVVHLPKELPYPLTQFYEIVRSVLQQYNHGLQLFILDQMRDADVTEQISKMNTEGNDIIYIQEPFSTLGAWLNAGRARAEGKFLLYIDNSKVVVKLKVAASEAFLMATERNPKAGLIYADYEITYGKKTEEVHLLKPHRGRLRDNQDYGFVYFFKQSAISECGGFDESLQFNTLYDIRLKMLEKETVMHISNRYGGSVYQVGAKNKNHNVFDYLLAAKDSQEEAENVLTEHLKRCKAYLAPGRFYQERNDIHIESELKASVIIPVNNRPEFIPVAIESILAQTVKDIEVIVVVNGGSTDPTNQIVKKYMVGGEKYNPDLAKVHLVPIDINNIGLCLNLGIKMAKGKYYIQLDSDDRLKPTAVEKILALFDSDPRIGIVIGSYEVWELNDTSGQLSRVDDIPVVTHDEWTEENGRNNLLRINGAGAPRAIPIKLIKDIGYFGINETPFVRNYGEDYDMVLRISERYKVGRIWDPIYEVVRHKGGTDHRIDVDTIQRNDEAKDHMRLQAVERRKKLNYA